MYNEYATLSEGEVAANIADKLAAIRLNKDWKQSTLAKRSGVSLGSIKRFECTGQISFKSLLKIAQALGRLEEINELFKPAPASSIDQLMAAKITKKRGAQ